MVIDPPDHWPSGIAILAGLFDSEETVRFRSSAEPWSQGSTCDGGVILAWREARFLIRPDSVTVDSSEPSVVLDRYWNPVLAAIHELNGVTALHGFAAQLGNGLAVGVLGPSGAGKTTTGIQLLLEQNSKLINDDLITLGSSGLTQGRPFVRRVPTGTPDEPTRDVGGKWRQSVGVAATPPPLSRVLVLDEDSPPEPTIVTGVQAISLLLRNPYLPFEVSSSAATIRLRSVTRLLESAIVLTAAPRGVSPTEMAGALRA